MKTSRNVENLLRGEEGGCCVPIGMPKYDRPMGTQFLDIVLNGRELRSMYTQLWPLSLLYIRLKLPYYTALNCQYVNLPMGTHCEGPKWTRSDGKKIYI